MRSLCQLKEVSKQTFYKGFEGIASQDEERQGKGGAEPKKYEFIPFWVSGLPCSGKLQAATGEHYISFRSSRNEI